MYDDDEDSFDELCAAKRRHVQAARVVSEPRKVEPARSERETDRLGRVFGVAMHKWLPWVEDLPFRTVFVDLARSEAAAIVRFMRTRDIVGGRVVERETANPEDLEVVKVVEERISKALESFPGARGFVKLSTRSPKDSVFDCYSDKTARLVDAELGRIAGPRDDNAEIAAFFIAANRAMCSDNGAQAMELFTQSLRIRQDLDRALKNEEEWDMCVVCREFADLPLQSEFRVFVHEGRLTAISQYFWFCFFPELVEKHNEYLDAMVRCYEEQLSKRVPYESYVVDFAVVGGKVIVIELNPFGDVSGACLFDWKEDADLLHGRLSGRPVLRVRLGPMPNARDRALVPLWDRYIQERPVSDVANTRGKTSGCC
jgi:hypothetical protein